MPPSRRTERAVLAVLFGAGIGALLLQLGRNEPVLGVLGLGLLLVPGYAIGRSLRPRPLAWPEILLVTLGSSLALAVLAGIVSALTPEGLDARAIAAAELPVLVVLTGIWIARVRGGEVQRPRRSSSGRRFALGPILLAGIGVTLAGAGIVVARLSAEAQDYGGFVQFWSLPATESSGATAGIRNMTGVTLDCAVAIDRLDRDGLTWPAGTVAPGQTILDLLPRADPDETAPWRLLLECTGNGEPITRQVTIAPPT